MKHLAKKVVSSVVNNDLLWPVLKPALKVGVFAYFSRKHPDDVSKTHLHLFEKLTVLNGPFKAMKYPSMDALCSAIYPKLIGSYEQELHPTIETFSTRDYSEIIDVGCAEGYYAVGLSLMFPKAKIYAYDIDPAARRLCLDMAKLNNRDSSISIRNFCTAKELASFNFTRRGLIVCDCEGFEKHLFNSSNLKNLNRCDIIIEVHDFVDIEISDYLNHLFKETHDIQVIKSIDDIEKAKTYYFKETEQASLKDKLAIFKEMRPGILEWMVCTPKSE
ncbi:class I SAM-dependent methyltransferase [Paradesertivirga mongoliensis]|uniref:Class I SAM-dependent methyltransferase n=1 Tax=Paradesertivirga mongoliensis TaxID=2100740 RepID=A0ABW4ZLF8_9SPHI|nr:class I SAM-dependent methyltransferase [Pedobacter mongoliensis]